MAKLTTHVLDLVHGQPGNGIQVDLYKMQASERNHIAAEFTNEDGRCGGFAKYPLSSGIYQLVFHAGEYFRSKGLQQPKPEFLDEIVIQFGIRSQESHYHVPLLLSSFGYSTYRGS